MTESEGIKTEMNTRDVTPGTPGVAARGLTTAVLAMALAAGALTSVRGQEAGQQAEETPAAAPQTSSEAATDKTREGLFAPEGHDTKQPIEIASDSLEVDQDQQIAVFQGNVDAVQGDLRLRTDKLEVHFEQDGDNTSTQSIDRMKAEGNVFIMSPNETAEGEWAEYEVSSRTITMRDNVRLTQGTNVLCGHTLEMNLDTGRSVLKGSCKTSKNEPSRVRGLFFPADD